MIFTGQNVGSLVNQSAPSVLGGQQTGIVDDLDASTAFYGLGQGDAEIGALSGGGFVATWSIDRSIGKDVRAQIFDADLNEIGDEIAVVISSPFSPREYQAQGISALDDGGLLVTFTNPGVFLGNAVGINLEAFGFNASGVRSTDKPLEIFDNLVVQNL